MANKGEDSLAISIFTLVLAIASVPAYGWAICWLWAWFVVPLGVVQIGWAAALGLILLLRLINGIDWYYIDTGKSQGERLTRASASFVAPFASVAFGWLYLRIFS